MVMPFAVAIWLSAITAQHTDVCPVVLEAPKSKGYAYRTAIALNQLLNTLTGGQEDETLSSRWGRTRKTKRFARFACAVLDKLQPCHCAEAVERGPDGLPLAHQLHR